MKARLTETEWKVMHVVWEAETPISAREVHEQVHPETDWAYDTVRTILNRLSKKGVLDSEVRSGTAYFSAVLTREEARRSSLSWIVDRAFDGTYAALMQFLVDEEHLSAGEREKIRGLLAQLEEEEERHD